MGVKVRKKGAKWYVVVDYHGRRKAKCVGSREAAEQVRRQVEAKLALGEDVYKRQPSASSVLRGSTSVAVFAKT